MNNKFKIAISVGILSLLSAFLIVRISHANPAAFSTGVQTAAATTSPAYMGIGTGTSTLTYNSSISGNPLKPDSSALLIQFAASSTSAVLNISIQYSQDGIDWYNDNISNNVATTTIPINLSVASSYTWKAAGTATTGVIINVPTPTRYVRAVSSLTGAAGAVWEQFVPNKQIQ